MPYFDAINDLPSHVCKNGYFDKFPFAVWHVWCSNIVRSTVWCLSVWQTCGIDSCKYFGNPGIHHKRFEDRISSRVSVGQLPFVVWYGVGFWTIRRTIVHQHIHAALRAIPKINELTVTLALILAQYQQDKVLPYWIHMVGTFVQAWRYSCPFDYTYGVSHSDVSRCFHGATVRCG